MEILTSWGLIWPHWITWIQTILSSIKGHVLINKFLHGIIRWKRGLGQGDPLSPLPFALTVDTLSAMFTLTLRSGVLVGVPLGQFGNISHLQYVDDLIIFIAVGQ